MRPKIIVTFLCPRLALLLHRRFMVTVHNCPGPGWVVPLDRRHDPIHAKPSQASSPGSFSKMRPKIIVTFLCPRLALLLRRRFMVTVHNCPGPGWVVPLDRRHDPIHAKPSQASSPGSFSKMRPKIIVTFLCPRLALLLRRRFMVTVHNCPGPGWVVPLDRRHTTQYMRSLVRPHRQALSVKCARRSLLRSSAHVWHYCFVAVSW
ncbi:uncharacterized protein LOC142559844 [Dermacentor variabilis]|uniref:uncharacterized protein LOC142559844 n=1 Tax=Dermacentor variabilis TaxID=34621 RepID=UPI003F5CA989